MKILRWVTFPGLALHLALHWAACRMLKLALFKAPSLGSDDMVHEPPRSIASGLLEGAFPPLLQFMVGAAVVLLAGLAWRLGASLPAVPPAVWLGWSLLAHAFPSAQDSRALMRSLRRSPVGFVLFVPLFPALWVGSRRRRGAHVAAATLLTALLVLA